MNNIELEAKTDRELLIIAIGLLNSLNDTVSKHEKWINGNGSKAPGAKFQLYILWGVFLAILTKIF